MNVHNSRPYYITNQRSKSSIILAEILSFTTRLASSMQNLVANRRESK